MMEEKDKVQYLQDNLSRVLGLISSADSKASTIVAIDTAMLGALVVLIPSPRLWTTSLLCCSVPPSALLILSILFLSFSTIPRTSGPGNSLLFFGAITRHTLEGYGNAVHMMTESEYVEDLIGQCYRNSQIAWQKHLWTRRSMVALYAAIPVWLIALFSFYQLKG